MYTKSQVFVASNISDGVFIFVAVMDRLDLYAPMLDVFTDHRILSPAIPEIMFYLFSRYGSPGSLFTNVGCIHRSQNFVASNIRNNGFRASLVL